MGFGFSLANGSEKIHVFKRDSLLKTEYVWWYTADDHQAPKVQWDYQFLILGSGLFQSIIDVSYDAGSDMGVTVGDVTIGPCSSFREYSLSYKGSSFANQNNQNFVVFLRNLEGNHCIFLIVKIKAMAMCRADDNRKLLTMTKYIQMRNVLLRILRFNL